jgi:hypothetical protein
VKANRLVIAAGFLLSATLLALAQQEPPQKPHHKPSDLLSVFFRNHLDRILSPIGQPVALPRTRVSELRTQFADQWAKAPDAKKPMFQDAVRVLDAVSAAMDEREKAIASLQGSAAVHGPTDLGAHRKDIPTRGGIGTALLADETLRREAHEEKNRKQEARQTDNFLTTQLKTQWTQRAIQLRQQIDQLYAREREAEGEARQSVAGNTGPAANTITVDKPIQVKVKYGTATIQPGTVLPIVSRDANGVVVQYMGENVILPP